MALFDTLGGDNIESDPNALPDGKWPGVIFKSNFAIKKNGEVAHVIEYKVTDGERAGAKRSEWWTLGTGALDAEGNPTEDANKVVDVQTATMSEQQKPWYRARWEALGMDFNAENLRNPASLVGKKVTFGTKKNGNFININFVELREPAAAPSTPPVTGEGGSVLGSL